jgi:plastocyanin
MRRSPLLIHPLSEEADMAEIISLADYGRRILLRRFVGGAGIFALIPPVLAAQAGMGTETVRIDNFTFSPTPLTIAPGTVVTWINHDDIPHSIYCEALNLRSHPLDSEESFSHRFEQPGRFRYICGIHPHMHGEVIVQR